MLDDAAGILRRLAASTGRELVSHRQQDLEPVSDGIILGYACTLRGPDDVLEHVTIYVNTSPDAPVDDQTVQLVDRATGERLTAWTYPQDPSLPSLPAVSYPEAAGVVLAKFGIQASGATLTMESYRPGKRAVLRVDTGDTQHFAKVVQPSLAATIHDLHVALHAAGLPVPRSLGYSESGLLLLERMPGDPALEHVSTIADDPRFLRELASLVDRLAAVRVGVAARESLARRADWYAARMAETAPVLAPRASGIVDRVRALYASTPVPTPVTVHGDLHLGQILVAPREPWRITGLIDIDTAGLGDRADDAAALAAHVVVTAFESATAGAREDAESLRMLAARLRASWADGGRTASIAAIHLVGHALAVAGRGDEHLQVAARLLDEADLALEAGLHPQR
ncbi:hypothetical protein GCM10009846_23300 [Agrococcus versicolor]|uniref:Aminoglycoside phosphotransferase domain-containing protein n=1 Tax=Agrococcus versicolor TaxID=501482 RepID=A0ABP5MKF4_9MICO